MDNISKYLSRFKKLKPTENILKNSCIDAVKKCCDIDIDYKDIKIQKDVIFIKSHNVIRNEIVFNKNKVLNYIRRQIPSFYVKDII